ncbi:MAG: hypothetical protein DI629_08190 [Mesorhizobium amorphae]|nr:MAG: hypothetical protein DI629_08190 [Mesorhizobium amorphae]
MFKTSLIALGLAAAIASPAAADTWYKASETGVTSPRITSQSINQSTTPDGVDNFTTRSISGDAFAAPAPVVTSPNVSDQIVNRSNASGSVDTFAPRGISGDSFGARASVVTSPNVSDQIVNPIR